MNERIQRQLNRFTKNLAARTQTEKLVVLGIAVAIVSLVFLTYVYDPVRAEISGYRNQVAAVNAQIANQKASYASKLAESQQDPDKFASDRLAAISQQQQVLFEEIASMAGNLITPNQMTAILSSVLGRQTGLQLVSFTNEEAKPLRPDLSSAGGGDASSAATLGAGSAGQVYEHGLTMEFEGDFFNTLRYLRFLEEISGSFFWDSVTFTQTEWPNAIITLKIHTLSTEEGFIGV